MDIPMILTKRYPDAEWTLNGDSYSGLTWLSEGDAPSAEELRLSGLRYSSRLLTPRWRLTVRSRTVTLLILFSLSFSVGI